MKTYKVDVCGDCNHLVAEHGKNGCTHTHTETRRFYDSDPDYVTVSCSCKEMPDDPT